MTNRNQKMLNCMGALCWLLVWLLVRQGKHAAEAFDPFGVGTGFKQGFARAYDLIACHPECCNDKYISLNLTGLKHDLQQELHGQHLVTDTVVRTLRGHFNNPHPEKALVLSFHGWTGSGKNFVSKIIARNLYARGMQSIYVNLYIATHHFPHVEQTEQYKDQLRSWIHGNVSRCQRMLFIFDEMDKMPPGVIDAIKPFIDHYTKIDGVDYRKTVFIFLSNTGGHAITEKALEQWSASRRREDLTLKDFEPLIDLDAFNEDGGLQHAVLIEKNLVSAFIPFLPMEREHVKLCIVDDIRRKNRTAMPGIVNRVADELQYYPPDVQLYSKSGCKRVSQKVDLILDDL